MSNDNIIYMIKLWCISVGLGWLQRPYCRKNGAIKERLPITQWSKMASYSQYLNDLNKHHNWLHVLRSSQDSLHKVWMKYSPDTYAETSNKHKKQQLEEQIVLNSKPWCKNICNHLGPIETNSCSTPKPSPLNKRTISDLLCLAESSRTYLNKPRDQQQHGPSQRPAFFGNGGKRIVTFREDLSDMFPQAKHTGGLGSPYFLGYLRGWENLHMPYP